MNLNEMVDKLGLRRLTPEVEPKAPPQITGGHASDLLSDVLANAPAGGVLVTIQVHLNVVAVAANTGLAAVIFSSDRIPDDKVLQKAVEEKTPLFVSEKTTFDIVGELYGLGIRGTRE